MKIELLSGYNSYYNRQVKVHNDYTQWAVYELLNVNFNPNDGVRTEHIINYPSDAATPDYLLVYDEDDNIVYRWFVLDAVRLRNGQYRMILKRDVIADYIYQVITSTCIVHKGYINDYNDPAIYNKDGNYNRIKKAEHALRDETRIPWVVGYINKDTADTTVSTTFADISDAYLEVDGITNWEHYNKTYTWNISATTWFNLYFKPDGVLNYCYPGAYAFTKTNLIEKEKTTTSIPIPATGFVYTHSRNSSYLQDVENLLANIRSGNEYFNLLNDWLDTRYDVIDEDNLIPFNGKIIKDTSTGISYRVQLNYGDGTYSKVNAPSSLVSYLDANLVDPTYPDQLDGESNSQTWQIGISTSTVSVELTQIMTYIKTTVTADRNHLEDAPYDMFCIPYGKLGVRYGTLTEKFNTNKDAAIAMATAISEQLGANCFDIQLLPYFPCQEILRSDDTDLRVARTKFNLIYDNSDNPISVMIWARKSEFTFNISNSLSNLPVQYDALSKKVRHETLMYRICSPNYASAFEFSPAANNGVTKYIVSCTYKPYDPYMHINPYFNEDGLYGGNYNDARGLICSGDFSLTQVNDAWVNYQLQNKNFQRMFDRQIESLELQQRVGKIQDVVGSIVGTGQGAATGAIMGAPGGGYGMAAGAILGGVSSLAGGIADISLNQQLRQDQLNLTRFNFNAQLDNIRALPDTLTKVSTLNPQNKLFPFVEVYEATDDEIKLCRESITWQGMTINRIATINNYRDIDGESFVQATLLRSDIRDNHLVTAIADELSQGVYFVSGGIL